MEYEADHLPDLFENDLIDWNKEKSLESYVKKLISMKKDSIFIDGNFHLEPKDDIAVFSYDDKDRYMLGIFNLENKDIVDVSLKDGDYEDYLSLEKNHS